MNQNPKAKEGIKFFFNQDFFLKKTGRVRSIF